jgi:hypothetical protein
MIVIMMDVNHISERLANIRQAISEIGIINARYRIESPHTALDKSAHTLREGRLLGIMQESTPRYRQCIRSKEILCTLFLRTCSC